MTLFHWFLGFITVFMLVNLSACTSDKLTVPGSVFCFETEILPLFISNCTSSGCHNSIDMADGYDLTNYAGILTGIVPKNVGASELIRVIEATSSKEVMPPPPGTRLSNEMIETIKVWINLGAPNTVNCEPEACDSTVVNYQGILPILQNQCIGCHTGLNAGAGYDYSSYAGIKSSVDDGSFLGAIEHNPAYSAMPLNGGKLSDCKIFQITEWIDAGALEN